MMMSDINNTTNTAEQETALGKTAMDQHDYESAIEHFGTALQLTIAAHDNQEDHPLAAPFYARYGKALLEAAVRSASMTYVNETAVEKNYGKLSQVEEPGKVIELSDEDDYEEQEEEEDQDEEQEEDEEEQNETNDFDLAFQMLDMARLLYSKQEGLEARQHESAVLEDLADLSMETEEFEQAIVDYQSAIAVLQSSTSTSLSCKRAMAALHFKLGMASEYSGAVQDAIKSLEEARRLIHSITADLQSSLGGKGKEKQDESTDDLSVIVKEVENKLEELKSGKTLNSQGNLHEAMAQAAATTMPANAAVNDLSSLVKKRRVE